MIDELPRVCPDRSPPCSLEAEEHVIGACLVDGNETIARAVNAGLTPDCFYSPANRLIWATIVGFWSSNAPVTDIALLEELRTQRQLDAVGGAAHIIQITSGIQTTTHAPYFIERVLEKHTLRKIIKAATAMVEGAYSYTGGLSEFISEHTAGFNHATGTIAETEEKFADVAKKLAAETQALAATGISPKRDVVPWGLIDLDQTCRPMEPGELVVLGGRPSTGKSALADQVAWRTADKLGHVLLFTYEMTKREKAIRIAQQIAGKNFNDLPSAPKTDVLSFAETLRKISECKRLHVFERDTAVSRLIARCRAFASRDPIRLIVVDFLQYLSRLEPMIGKERTDEKIGRITAALKDLARECKCPVLMLASLNRDGEKENRAPRMSDLRASGEIESDADVIALLHWPKNAPNGQQQDAHDNGQNEFYVEFNQEKGRNKGVHQAGLHFNRRATKFQNYTP